MASVLFDSLLIRSLSGSGDVGGDRGSGTWNFHARRVLAALLILLPVFPKVPSGSLRARGLFAGSVRGGFPPQMLQTRW